MATEPTGNGQDGEGNDGPKPGDGPGAVAAAAEGELTPQVINDATDWFLSDDTEDVASAILPINVAPAGHREKVVEFGIQVLQREKIKELREQSSRDKQDGTKEVDEMEANLRIAVEGLIKPNLRESMPMKIRGQEYLDPADALLARFAHKPGIIDQIATQVTMISGYNDKDVKEVKAAGN